MCVFECAEISHCEWILQHHDVTLEALAGLPLVEIRMVNNEDLQSQV